MASDSQTAPNPKWMFWTGWVLTALSALGLTVSAATKFMPPSEEMTKGFAHLGYDISLAMPLGIVELTCVFLYVFPRTSVLGAILLTGYLGGAIATHVRIGDPFFVQIILGVLIWLGIYLRCSRLRALVPLRS